MKSMSTTETKPKAILTMTDNGDGDLGVTIEFDPARENGESSLRTIAVMYAMTALMARGKDTTFSTELRRNGN